MQRSWVVLILFSVLFPVALRGQEVFVHGDNAAAAQARTDLQKYTHYRLGDDSASAVLVVTELSWSPDFLSPAVPAIRMELVAMRGSLLWSKVEPLGSRSKEAVVQELLKELAQAKPSFKHAPVAPAAAERKAKGA